MRLALVTDAWKPQVNGVVRTLSMTIDQLRARGVSVDMVTPDQFATVPCPSYPEIRLALASRRAVARMLDGWAPDSVHIATEGPLGWAARRWCLEHRQPFTTSFHTRFPDYVAARTGLPARLFWPVIRRFHGPAAQVFVATGTLARELEAHGLTRTHPWSRGVDLAEFRPDRAAHPLLTALPRPVQLYVGRVAVEKNIGDFLACEVAGSKVVVGDGPARAALERQYPAAHFLGPLHGGELASAYAGADVLVFPSRTDTFGLVNVEALASGTPVAAYPVPGPLDILGADGFGVDNRAGGRIGGVDADLARAIRTALAADRRACAAEGRRYSWERCTDEFLRGLSWRPAAGGRIAA